MFRRWLRRVELRLKNSHFYAHRQAAKRVFYPGCSLPGADPEFCLDVYQELLKLDPAIGLWFDCCSKPLRMAKDERYAEKQERRLVDALTSAGVEEVITACVNCYAQFTAFPSETLKVRMIYDLLEVKAADMPSLNNAIMHHPCHARSNPQLQASALRLSAQLGLEVKNRDDKGHPLPCCLHRTDHALKRRAALAGERLVTYCAHCVMSFQEDIPSRHLLQELFGSKAQWAKRGKVDLFNNYRRFCQLAVKKQAGKSALTDHNPSQGSASVAW